MIEFGVKKANDVGLDDLFSCVCLSTEAIDRMWHQFVGECRVDDFQDEIVLRFLGVSFGCSSKNAVPPTSGDLSSKSPAGNDFVIAGLV